MVVEAPPPSAFVVAQSQFLLEFLIVSPDPPTQLGGAMQNDSELAGNSNSGLIPPAYRSRQQESRPLPASEKRLLRARKLRCLHRSPLSQAKCGFRREAGHHSPCHHGGRKIPRCFIVPTTPAVGHQHAAVPFPPAEDRKFGAI